MKMTQTVTWWVGN